VCLLERCRFIRVSLERGFTMCSDVCRFMSNPGIPNIYTEAMQSENEKKSWRLLRAIVISLLYHKHQSPPYLRTHTHPGKVKVWDPRQKEEPVACMEPAEGDTHRDCWTVTFGNSFNDTDRCVCAGYDNGDIKLFDLRTMTLRWETTHRNGFSTSTCL
jgi:WD40 repeat protein